MFRYPNPNGLLILLVLTVVISACGVLVCWWVPGVFSWGRFGWIRTIPGPHGFPIIGWLLKMSGIAHRRLVELALVQKATTSLWERIFRGRDTTATLTEWIMAEVVLHPEFQLRVQQEFRTRRINYIVGVPTLTTERLCGKQMTVKRSGAVTVNQLQRLNVEVRFTPSLMLRPDGKVEVIVIMDYLRFEVVNSQRTNNDPDHFIQSLKIKVRPTGKWSESFSEGFGLIKYSPGNELNPLSVQRGRSRGFAARVNVGVSPSAALQFNRNNASGTTFHAFGFKKSTRDGHAYVCEYELRTFEDGSSAQNLRGRRFYTIPKIPEAVRREVNYPNLGNDASFAGTWMIPYGTARELRNELEFTISLEANLAAVRKCERFSLKPPEPELKVWKGDSSTQRLCYY